MPCGKKNCIGCKSCKYDLPLDAPLLKMRTKEMEKFGIMPVGDNPATAQIIIPGATTRHHIAPMGVGTQLTIPFKGEAVSSNESQYCNECPHFMKIQRPNKSSYNTRCGAETPRPGGSERVIKLNVYEYEKVKKPFWCPMVKKSLTDSLNDGIKIGGRTVFPARKTSAMSEEQINAWNISKNERLLKEKWLSAPGLTSWAELKVGRTYHLPPTSKKARMDVEIKQKYVGSIQAINLKTNENVWFYKDDEEYKYMSLIK